MLRQAGGIELGGVLGDGGAAGQENGNGG